MCHLHLSEAARISEAFSLGTSSPLQTIMLSFHVSVVCRKAASGGSVP